MMLTKRLKRLFFSDGSVIFATVFISLCALVLWFFIRLIDIEKYKIENSLEMQAARLESMLSDNINHTFAIIKSMNSQIAKDHNNKAYINQILGKFKTSPDLSDAFSWTSFSWTNSHHKIIVDARYGVLKKPINLSHRDYIPLTVEDPKKFHLGGPVVGATSKQWLIPGGVGAVDKDGKYLGAMVIGFKIDSLTKSLYKALQDGNVGFELVNQEGTKILYGYNSSFGTSKGSFIEGDLIKSMLEELRYSDNNVSISDVSLFRNRHAILTRKIKNFPYYLVLRYDDRLITDALWMSFISRLVEILLLFFTTAFLLTYLNRRKIRKIRELMSSEEIDK